MDPKALSAIANTFKRYPSMLSKLIARDSIRHVNCENIIYEFTVTNREGLDAYTQYLSYRKMIIQGHNIIWNEDTCTF